MLALEQAALEVKHDDYLEAWHESIGLANGLR